MKIGLIANNIDPVQRLNNGSHLHFIEVAKRWPDHELVVFAPALARNDFLDRLPGARFVAMPSLDHLINVERRHYAAFLMRAVLSPAAAAEIQRCDVALATTHFLQDVVPAAYAMGRNAAFTLWHTMIAPWSGGNLSTAPTFLSERLSVEIASRWLGGVLGGSAFVLRQHGFDKRTLLQAITVNGVEHLMDGGATQAEGRISQSDAIFLGRLWPTKGIEDLLDAWSIVNEGSRTATLKIIGDGEPNYRAKLEARVQRDPKLRRSTAFLGRISEEDKVAQLRSSKMFIFPSREEGWGIAIAEAMALGLPCVTYDLPVYRDIFRSGRLAVPTGNVASLAEAILKLLGNEGLRNAMAQDARESMSGMTWDNAADVELALLAKLSKCSPRLTRPRTIEDHGAPRKRADGEVHGTHSEATFLPDAS